MASCRLQECPAACFPWHAAPRGRGRAETAELNSVMLPRVVHEHPTLREAADQPHAALLGGIRLTSRTPTQLIGRDSNSPQGSAADHTSSSARRGLAAPPPQTRSRVPHTALLCSRSAWSRLNRPEQLSCRKRNPPAEPRCLVCGELPNTLSSVASPPRTLPQRACRASSWPLPFSRAGTLPLHSAATPRTARRWP
jgi:hypothetical protein